MKSVVGHLCFFFYPVRQVNQLGGIQHREEMDSASVGGECGQVANTFSNPIHNQLTFPSPQTGNILNSLSSILKFQFINTRKLFRGVDLYCMVAVSVDYTNFQVTSIMKSVQKQQPFVSCVGGEASGNKAHTLLPHALREGPVQQPTVEELEYTMSSSGDNHRKQLYRHEGRVCTRH